MLTNATLLRIDTAAPAANGVGVAFIEGAALSVPCILDEPTNTQRWTLGAAIGGASAVLYVMVDELPAGTVLDKGMRVVAQLEGHASATYGVVVCRTRVKDEVGHYELFLEAVVQ